MAMIVEQQSSLVQQLLESRATLQSDRNAGEQSNAAVTLERFKKLGPPPFHGTTDPIVAETWLKQIEKIFLAMGCNDEQKVIFASFVLQGDADHWWETKARLLRNGQDGRPISWTMFIEAFLERYFPERIHDQMEADFLKLTQGSKSVAEYEEQFTSLSRFAPTLVANERSKCRRFLGGLCLAIRSHISVLKLNVYSDVVDRAVIAERDLNESQVKRDHRNKQNYNDRANGRGSNKQDYQGYNRGNKNGQKYMNSANIQRNAPTCTRYGNFHRGECYLNTGACFYCGQTGHRIKDCPKRQNDTQGDDGQRKKLKTQGRVFAMTEQDA